MLAKLSCPVDLPIIPLSSYIPPVVSSVDLSATCEGADVGGDEDELYEEKVEGGPVGVVEVTAPVLLLLLALLVSSLRSDSGAWKCTDLLTDCGGEAGAAMPIALRCVCAICCCAASSTCVLLYCSCC